MTTPRDCCWRLHGLWRHDASGTDRRPTTTACSLRGNLQLPSAFAARKSRGLTWRISFGALSSRGNTSREGPVPPPCSPGQTRSGGYYGRGGPGDGRRTSWESSMAIVEVHPEPIDGPWIEGFVLDTARDL